MKRITNDVDIVLIAIFIYYFYMLLGCSV